MADGSLPLEHRAPARRRFARALPKVLVAAPAAIAVLLVLDWSLAAVRPATRSQVWLWLTVSTGAPVWFGAVLLLTMVVPTILLARSTRLPQVVVEALLVVEFTAYFLSTRMSPMTGDSPALLQQASRPDAWLSEALADAVHKAAFQVGGDFAVRHVGPVVGAAAIAAWMFLARRVSDRWGLPLDLVRAFVLATPLVFWFFVDYTENTFLALPFLIAAIGVLVGPPTRRGLAAAGVLLGLAVAMHAMNLVMVGSVVVFLLMRRFPWRRRVLDALTVGGIVVAVEAIVLLACALAGLRFNAYNMTGCYDRTMWVPFSPIGYLFRFTFVSHAHLIDVANIAVHAAPLLVLPLPLLLLRRRAAAQAFVAQGRRDEGLILLALMSLAHLCLVSIWGFDFGTSGDLDLMLTLDVPLTLYLLILVHRLVDGRVAVMVGLIAGSALCNLAFYSYKVSLVWWPPTVVSG